MTQGLKQLLQSCYSKIKANKIIIIIKNLQALTKRKTIILVINSVTDHSLGFTI